MKIAIVLCTLFALTLAVRPVPYNLRERSRYGRPVPVNFEEHSQRTRNSHIRYHGDYERRTTGRIIGGNNDIKYSHPYQISLQRLPSSGDWYHTCGGSIISPTRILTAAHCVDDTTVTASDYRVVAGEYELYSDESVEQTIGASKLVIHPNWDASKINNDVAIVHLKSSITYNSYAGKVDLASSKPANGTKSTVTGWGWTDYASQTRPTILQALSTVTYTDGKVYQTSWWTGEVTELTVDPGYFTSLWDPNTQVAMYNSNKGVCKGDSGGPLIVDSSRLQYGIVSYGQLPCGENRPDYFANVAYFKNWIESN